MVLTPTAPVIQSVPQEGTILTFGVGTLLRTPSSQHKPDHLRVILLPSRCLSVDVVQGHPGRVSPGLEAASRTLKRST